MLCVAEIIGMPNENVLYELTTLSVSSSRPTVAKTD